MTLTGTAEFRATVSILRGGEAVTTVEPARDGTFSVEVALVEGVNAFTAVAANHAGDSPASNEVAVVLDTTGPALDWTPADGDGFFESTITVAGTAVDEFAPRVELTVNGVAVTVAADGTWSTTVDLAEGANTLSVEATDALGNTTAESRAVGHISYSAAWQIAGGGGRGAVVVLLDVADQAGLPVEVDSATAEVVESSGEVAASELMRWDAREERYQAVFRRLDTGTYQVVGRLVIDGWNVRRLGPEVVVR